MDPMGGIVMTNDGNAILREITVQHPAAKTMIEIARTQDEEVGDGTTSVIVLAAEMLGVSHQFLEEKMHPTVVIQAYRQALEDAAVILRDNVATKIDLDDAVAVRKVIQSCVGTKFIAKWSDLACDIAMDAVKTVTMAVGEKKEIDIKRYAKVEKIPGGTIEDSSVLKGVMFNKDVTHPKMKRKIENPKNSCTELWCQHHPLTHSIEGQARQGGGEERELGDQWGNRRTGGHVCSWHLGTPLCKTAGVQDCH